MKTSYGETSGFTPVANEPLTTVNGGSASGCIPQPDIEVVCKTLETIVGFVKAIATKTTGGK